MLFPVSPDKGGRGKKASNSVAGFSHTLLSQARAVLAYSPELAIEVRAGSRTFVLQVLQQWIGAINGQDRCGRPLRRHFRPPGLSKKISGCALRQLPKIWRPRLWRSNLRRMRDAPRSSGPRRRRGA
jgi:hypothetical protein